MISADYIKAMQKLVEQLGKAVEIIQSPDGVAAKQGLDDLIKSLEQTS